MTRVVQALCLFIVFGVWGPASAQDAELAKFYGRFVGSGVADNSDSAYFRTSVRDFEVLINPIASGFNITWTTTTRGGTPSNPKIKRKTNKLDFVATQRPGIYAAMPQGDPLMSEPFSWAQVVGNDLNVFSITLNEQGQYEIQQYRRRLVPTGMELEFKRIREGEEVRTVRGRLTREKQE